jgi:glutamate racemase
LIERSSTGDRPIGVFDSGVGGLSVLRAIRQELPAEDLVYVADSAYAPYGEKPERVIGERADMLVRFLVDRGVKAVVVACNTATGVSAEALRSRFDLPIVAIEPALKPAAAQTKTGVIGVLATARTLASRKFLKLMEAHGKGVDVVLQACPGLVQQVERGEFDGPTTRALLDEYVRPLLAKGADTLVLGCTHYPFLRPLLDDVAGPAVSLIDPAMPVARELHRRLAATGLLTERGRQGTEHFFTTGSVGAVTAVIGQLWPGSVHVDPLDATSLRKP